MEISKKNVSKMSCNKKAIKNYGMSKKTTSLFVKTANLDTTVLTVEPLPKIPTMTIVNHSNVGTIRTPTNGQSGASIH